MKRRHFHPRSSVHCPVRSLFLFLSSTSPSASVLSLSPPLPLHCQFVCVFGVDVDWGNCPNSVRPSVRPKCSGANGHLEINVWLRCDACLPQ